MNRRWFLNILCSAGAASVLPFNAAFGKEEQIVKIAGHEFSKFAIRDLERCYQINKQLLFELVEEYPIGSNFHFHMDHVTKIVTMKVLDSKKQLVDVKYSYINRRWYYMEKYSS